jgi:hypothetical protein
MSQVFEIVLTENDVRLYRTFQGILNIMPRDIKIEASPANAWLPADGRVDRTNENLEPDTVLIVDKTAVYSVFRRSVIE